MLEWILHGTVNIHWFWLTMLCVGTSCLGFVAAAICAMAARRDEMEYGPMVRDVEPEGE